MSTRDLPALVVGAGPAGLATSRELLRRGVAHRVLERGDRVGASWARLYDSLRHHVESVGAARAVAKRIARQGA